MTGAGVRRGYWDGWGVGLLWTSMALGPLAVSLDLGAGYALVKPLCAGGDREMLRAVSLGALILSAAGIAIGIMCFARLRRSAVDDGERVIDRSYFTALVAVGLDVLCTLLVLTAAGARIIVPCE